MSAFFPQNLTGLVCSILKPVEEQDKKQERMEEGQTHNGAWPRTVLGLTSAPLSTRIFEHSSEPAITDQCNGVLPTLSRAFTAAPFSSSNFVRSIDLMPTERCREVLSCAPVSFTSCPRDSKFSTVPTSPLYAALISSVSSGISRMMCSTLNNYFQLVLLFTLGICSKSRSGGGGV